ncbi:MAG: DUF4383 domain-containing protein [Gaiellaceae bacterium MAG52_C11]|nr:DUF4383 domain-containing protein [Candidatus Gaiellasilicea maunaloa]
MNHAVPVQTVARLVGIVFLLVGIAGFVPGVTTNLYEGLEFAGDAGNAELLGLFEISILHNIVHALFGVGVLMAATPAGARTYLLGSGALYVVLFLIGIVGVGEWVPINGGDNWLHLGLAVGLIALGLITTRERDEVGRRDPSR